MRIQIGTGQTWTFYSDEKFLYGRSLSDQESMCSIFHNNIIDMKIYRNHHMSEDGESHGYSFFTKKSDALRAFKQEDWHEYFGGEKAQEIEVKFNKEGLLKLLRRHASHPNNG